jgi:hypothetical protein
MVLTTVLVLYCFSIGLARAFGTCAFGSAKAATAPELLGEALPVSNAAAATELLFALVIAVLAPKNKFALGFLVSTLALL